MDLLQDWDSALLVYPDAADLFSRVLLDPDQNRHVQENLPLSLQRFSRGSVLAYVLTKSVDVLERRKRHREATTLLKTLLAQSLYLPDYHGHW